MFGKIINVNFLWFFVVIYQKTTSSFKFTRKGQLINQISFAIIFKQVKVKLYCHIYIFTLIAR